MKKLRDQWERFARLNLWRRAFVLDRKNPRKTFTIKSHHSRVRLTNFVSITTAESDITPPKLQDEFRKVRIKC